MKIMKKDKGITGNHKDLTELPQGINHVMQMHPEPKSP